MKTGIRKKLARQAASLLLILLMLPVWGILGAAAQEGSGESDPASQPGETQTAPEGDSISDEPDGDILENPEEPDGKAVQPDDSADQEDPEPTVSEEPEVPDPVQVTLTAAVKMVSRTEGCALPASDAIPVTVQPMTEGSAFTQHISSIAADRTSAGGSGNLTFGPYTQAGEHRYAVTFGLSGLKDWVLNDREDHYQVEITVSEEMELTTRIYPAQLAEGVYTVSGEPVDALQTVKTYREPLTIQVTKRWPDGGERPVIIKLMEVEKRTVNGKSTEVRTEVGKVTMTKKLGWQHTFTQDATTGWLLHPDKKYEVDEVDMFKFSESYKYDKKDPCNWKITITNSEALYQTGPKTGPIVVLFAAGMVMMFSGACLMRKRSHE